MENIWCMYHDDTGDQDMTIEPTLDEALANFERFDWGNGEVGIGIKVLYFGIPNDSEPSIMITNNPLEPTWCVTTSMRIRRRFCGPFFKKIVTKTLMDIDRQAVNAVIRRFYEDTGEAYLHWLQEGEAFVMSEPRQQDTQATE